MKASSVLYKYSSSTISQKHQKQVKICNSSARRLAGPPRPPGGSSKNLENAKKRCVTRRFWKFLPRTYEFERENGKHIIRPQNHTRTEKKIQLTDMNNSPYLGSSLQLQFNDKNIDRVHFLLTQGSNP